MPMSPGATSVQAELAALLDAALQDPARHDALMDARHHAAGRAPAGRTRRRSAPRRGHAGGFPGHADDAMSTLTPGFADPVLDGQATFRAVLEAMSRPGRIQRAGSALRPPAPLNQAAAAVLLTLADADTGFAHDAGAAAEAWLRFHCGMPLVPAAARPPSCWRPARRRPRRRWPRAARRNRRPAPRWCCRSPRWPKARAGA